MTAMAVVPATDLATAPEKRPTLEGVFLRLDLASLSRIYGLRDDCKALGAVSCLPLLLASSHPSFIFFRSGQFHLVFHRKGKHRPNVLISLLNCL